MPSSRDRSTLAVPIPLGSYLRYSGRNGNVLATAAHDPLLKRRAGGNASGHLRQKWSRGQVGCPGKISMAMRRVGQEHDALLVASVKLGW